MRWFVGTIGRLWHGGHRMPPVDREALREEMARNDPAFARVRKVQHDARGLLGALGNAEQLRERQRHGRALQREADFWRRHRQAGHE